MGIFRYELLFWQEVVTSLGRFCKEQYKWEILLAVIGLVTGFLLEGSSWLPVISSLISLFLLLVIVVAYNLVAVPSRIYKKSQNELKETKRLLGAQADSSPNIICTKASAEFNMVSIPRLMKLSNLARPGHKRDSESKVCFVAQAKFANEPTTTSNRVSVKSVAAHIRYLDMNLKQLDTKFDQPVFGCWVDSDEEVVSVDLEANGLPKTLALASHIPGEKCVYPSDIRTRRNAWRDFSRMIDVPEFYVSVTLKSGGLVGDKSVLFRIKREDTSIEAVPTTLTVAIESSPGISEGHSF